MASSMPAVKLPPEMEEVATKDPRTDKIATACSAGQGREGQTAEREEEQGGRSWIGLGESLLAAVDSLVDKQARLPSSPPPTTRNMPKFW
jgi:hypothetical protein